MLIEIKILPRVAFFAYFINSLFIGLVYSKSAITYNFRGSGRFGDKVVLWGRAKVLSIQYGVPLLYKPFPYSDKLAMHHEEIRYSSQVVRNFKKQVQVKNETILACCNDDSVLFLFDFFTPLNSSLHDEFHLSDEFFADIIYERMILYPKCRNAIQKMLQPIITLPSLNLHPDRVSVAVHVRKGGGMDLSLGSIQNYSLKNELSICVQHLNKAKKFADEFWPLKFPPEQFYIDQIKKLSDILSNAPMYVFIFTDDKNPVELLERFRRICNKPNIIFDCRKGENGPKQNIIEDFYAMSKFDCLIRGCSNFAGAVQLLGNHKIIIRPRDSVWKDDILIMNKVDIIFPDTVNNKLFEYPFDLSYSNEIRNLARLLL